MTFAARNDRSVGGQMRSPAIETMAPDAIASLQGERLRAQLAYIAAHSPFYERKWRAAGFDPARLRSPADLSAAPFTEKDELRASQMAAPPLGTHASATLADVIRVHSTSGTTGRPSFIGITRADADQWTESLARVFWCEGVRREDVFVHAVGLSFFVGGLPVKDAIEAIGATFVPIGTGASERLVQATEALSGSVLFCTPSYAFYLAEKLAEAGSDPRSLGFRLLTLGAEPGGGIPDLRARLEHLYGARVTEAYGNGDVLPAFAATCEEADGNHFLVPDFVVLELIDVDTGEVLPWEDGARGELVATHLARECCPLVRFRTRDHIVVRTSPCPCGRTGPRWICEGRTDDMLIVAGVNVWPSAISDVVGSFAPRTTGALRILVNADGPAVPPPLRIRAEHGEDAGDLTALRRELEERIRAKLVVKAKVELVPPRTLERFEMKARYVERTDAT
jgi:phenylacetate-CoA ligase